MPPLLAALDSPTAGLWPSLALALPEACVAAAVAVLLFLRLVPALDRLHLGWAALWLAAVPLGLAVGQLQRGDGGLAFAGLFELDGVARFVRVLLLGFLTGTVLLTLTTGIPDAEDSADFYVLLFGGTLGMLLMTTADHLLGVYLAVEMASLPGYALAGWLKGRRTAGEAALKYVIYGSAASGTMLYGMSLVAGHVGSASLKDIADAFARGGGADAVVLLGTLLVLAGLGFKLAAVPFHFWCPDVFEGSAAEVAGFLSAASKAAALALTARVLSVFAASPHLADVLVPAVAVMAGLTATVGNLAAFGQTNMKRLLAWSTVAHAGYMLMGLSVMRPEGTAAVLVYLTAYLLMNGGAFAAVAWLRNRTGTEDLSGWRGLGGREPLLVGVLAVCLLSLLGLPPLAGFVGKFQVFAALYDAGADAWTRGGPRAGLYLGLLAVAGVNTVFGAVYYLNVLRVLVLEPAPSPEPPAVRPVPAAGRLMAAGVAAAVVALGVAWGAVADAGLRAAEKPREPAATAEAR